MAQWLRLLVALADNLNLVPTTHTVASKSPVVWQQNFWYTLLASAGTRQHMVCILHTSKIHTCKIKTKY